MALTVRARRPLEIPSGRLKGQRWQCVPGSVVRSVCAGRFAPSPLHREPQLVRRRARRRRDLASQPSGTEGAGKAAGGDLRCCSGCPEQTPDGKPHPLGLLPALPKSWLWGVAAPHKSGQPRGLQERCLEF
ncbi:hypothetical protein HJG60_011349 [Phyllostomus discolor]|uniref:Uncharacterized protein n=1 Tax=Phyllostomus discolor TaxID=89673 RepID=A0A833ZXL3_9CHIR|nr:hypothetical protein HJG60_011349 [Phyllostomus discolor]